MRSLILFSIIVICGGTGAYLIEADYSAREKIEAKCIENQGIFVKGNCYAWELMDREKAKQWLAEHQRMDRWDKDHPGGALILPPASK